MKLTNLTDVDGFFKVVNNCKGRVELVTNEGDCLNLKSRLTQCVSMSKFFAYRNEPGFEIELKVANPDDVESFLKFMMQEKTM